MACSFAEHGSSTFSPLSVKNVLEPTVGAGTPVTCSPNAISQPATGATTPLSLRDTTCSPPTAPVCSGRSFGLLELELIHHYSTSTYMFMTSKLTAHAVWRDLIFREALKHDFLLDALMATSALHKAMSHGETTEIHARYTKVALSYQNAALARYIPALSNPNKSNAIALFALSALLSIWMFGSKKLPEALSKVNLMRSPRFKHPNVDDGTGNDVDGLIAILTLVQGINMVVKEVIQWLEGDIWEILRPPSDDELPPISPEVEHSFRLLEQRMNEFLARHSPGAAAQEKHGWYLEHLTSLRKVARCRSVLERDSFIFSWPVLAEAPFIDLVRQKDPVVLALFVHWAACFKSLDHMWWAKGWSYTLVNDGSALLDDTWSSVTRWPRQEVGAL